MDGSLTRILKAFEEARQPLCLSQIARQIDKPHSVVEGMLGTLVEMDLLVCMDRADPCGDCPLQSRCRPAPGPERAYGRAAAPERDRAGQA